MQQKLVAVERVMSKEEAEALDARIMGIQWIGSGPVTTCQIPPSVGAV